MKKKSLLVTILLLLITVFAFSLTACNNEVGTLESLQNEYGIVVDGGSFEEGSTLVSNEIVATTEEAAEVLTAIADQNYNKDGNVYIFDIYVTKDGKEVQPNGKVKVSIPVPNVQVDNYLVFHIKSDNSVESLVPTVADGKIHRISGKIGFSPVCDKDRRHGRSVMLGVQLLQQRPACGVSLAGSDSFVAKDHRYALLFP